MARAIWPWLAIVVVFTSGCVGLPASIGDMYQSYLGNREKVLDEREHQAKIRQDEREAERLAARIEQDRCREKAIATVPEIESTLALNLRQRFQVGEPEVDLAEMERRIKVLKEGAEERDRAYRAAVRAWHEETQRYYQNLAREAVSGSELDCCVQRAPVIGPPPPPEPERFAIKMQDIPLILRVNVASAVDQDRTEFEDVRAGRAPVKQPCKPKCCPEPACDAPQPVPIPPRGALPAPLKDPDMPPPPERDPTAAVPAAAEALPVTYVTQGTDQAARQ